MSNNKKEKKAKAGEKKAQQKSSKENDAKIKDLVDSLQRQQADFENYRKRVEKEKEEFREYSKSETISRLLPIIDNFELALKHTCSKENLIEGIKMIFSQMVSEIESMGAKKIEALGRMFDPYVHEAIMADYSSKPKDTIIEEFQAGYKIGCRIIRHSKVKISKGLKEKKEIKDIKKENEEEDK